MNSLWLIVGLLYSSLCGADINVYRSTDNTGINKLERIEVIEQYLISLSTSLKSMEAKVEANTLKLGVLENSLKARELDIKNIQGQLTEKKPAASGAESSELEKLKADILSIKNEDIERIRRDIQLLKLK